MRWMPAACGWTRWWTPARPAAPPPPAFLMLKQPSDRISASAQADVLAEMAYGTGGSFFQNNNDLDAGFAPIGGARRSTTTSLDSRRRI